MADPPENIRADATSLWRRLGVLPKGVDPSARASEICVAGYQGNTLVAICTAELTTLPPVQCRFAMVRMLVAPEHRAPLILSGLAAAAYTRLETWSRDAAGERVMGMGAVVESANLRFLAQRPVWPVRSDDPNCSGLVLIGYTDRGEQVRAAWFEHARLS